MFAFFCGGQQKKKVEVEERELFLVEEEKGYTAIATTNLSLFTAQTTSKR
jgi:hypothetical protein